MVVERGLKLTDLAALGMALSNTFGLSVGILLMGYGLVEIPRGMWKSNPQQLLKWSAHRSVYIYIQQKSQSCVVVVVDTMVVVKILQG